MIRNFERRFLKITHRWSRINILVGGLTFIFLTSFIFTVYAKGVGVDKIVPLRVNSFSVDTATDTTHLKLAIEVDKTFDFTPNADIKKAAQKFLEHFFIGLVLPDEKFWVNLNPKEPYRMLDSALADTDLGRIMLYADLRLKKDTCELMNPNESAVGREYWNRLYKKAKQLGVTDKIPLINKIWIMPDEVTLYETENQLSIVKSRLKVCIEGDKLGGHPLQNYALSLMEELILPRLNEKVNESHLYADLRGVYQALILARWYKQKLGQQQNFLLQNVSYNILKDTEIDFLYRPDQIYRDYVNSFKKGEYTFSAGTDSFYSAMTIMRYFIGGVNFRKIEVTKASIPNSVKKGSAVFTVNFNLPNFESEKPLTLAKNTISLTPGSDFQIQGEDSEGSPVFVKNLPPVVPIKSHEPMEKERRDRILFLSRL